MRWCLPFILVALTAAPAEGQYQASTIEVSRNLHDLGWAATGLATTFTLHELGVDTKPATLIGSIGIVGLVKLYECTKWCRNASVRWPAGVALKDTAYDLVLASATIPVLVAKKHGWKAGLASGAAWIGTVLLLREAKWNSP